MDVHKLFTGTEDKPHICGIYAVSVSVLNVYEYWHSMVDAEVH